MSTPSDHGRRMAFARARVIAALIFREMSSRYGRSWGGYVWAVAEPVGGIMLLTIAFSFALHKPPLGTNFALFYASGVVPFLMYGGISSALAAAVQANKGLLAYPAVTAVDTLIARWILETVSYVMVTVVVFSAVFGFYGAPSSVHLEYVISAFAMTTFFAAGIGSLNCALFGFFPIWKHIWSVLNRPLFIISGIIFTYDSMPDQLQGYMWYNPIMHFIGEMRRGLYGYYDGAYISYMYVYGVSSVFIFIGFYLVRRHQNFLSNNN